MRYVFLYILLLLSVGLMMLLGCITTDTAYTRVAPGIWRGVLELEKFSVPVRDKDTIFTLVEQFREGEVPFLFEVKYIDEEHFYIEIINGSERIRCDSIQYGRDRSQARDTFNIFFPEYATYIHAEVRGGAMQGEWIVTTKENYRIPFYAHAGRGYRFTSLNQKPIADLSGQWAALFGIEEDKPGTKAIGEFRQKGNHLEGTFRTETGDYRFLEGTVQGRKFWLSAFDGAHAFLFSGSIQPDSTLQGEFRSGTHYRTLWKAWRDTSFQLGHPDSLTKLRPGAQRISFDLTTCEGERLVFPGPAFEGKVKIFTIMGTWCPNCSDELRFLVEFLKEHPEWAQQVRIVGFAFERHKPEVVNTHLQTYKQRLGLPFDLVYAGKADKKAAEEVFPALSNVMAFPTMIIIDKQNRVRSIHTGFDGPATSQYGVFKEKFTRLIQTLVNE